MYPFTYDDYKSKEDELGQGGMPQHANEMQHAAFLYQLIKHLQREIGNYDLHSLLMFSSRDFNSTKEHIVEQVVSPILYFLHDSLDRSSSVIYLLEKYKRRTEWFTFQPLIDQYLNATANYEEVFDRDLRMFLFDQGIDYPFSTPSSASGRADIIGSIDTTDPIIIEVKVFDREKGYSKNRVKDGLTQAIKYTGDYNKDIGYVVLFNMDKAELNFKLENSKNIFPPMYTFNNKTYFFIVINLWKGASASKVGTTEAIDILEEDLTK